MADAPEPGSAWGPIGLLVLIIGGALLALYIQGNLGKLDAKSLLIPPPSETSTTTSFVSGTDANGNNYGGQSLEQNAYTMDPNPVHVTNQPTQ